MCHNFHTSHPALENHLHITSTSTTSTSTHSVVNGLWCRCCMDGYKYWSSFLTLIGTEKDGWRCYKICSTLRGFSYWCTFSALESTIPAWQKCIKIIFLWILCDFSHCCPAFTLWFEKSCMLYLWCIFEKCTKNAPSNVSGLTTNAPKMHQWTKSVYFDDFLGGHMAFI